MARQTEEWVKLYRRQDFPGEPLPINLQGPVIPGKVPSDHEIRDAVQDLPSGRAGGALKMRGGHQMMATWHYVGGGPREGA
jgi:hypothetical protein